MLIKKLGWKGFLLLESFLILSLVKESEILLLANPRGIP